MNLTEVCARLHEFESESMIFAREPWTPESQALVVPFGPDEDGPPESACPADMTYLIEVYIAQEFIEGWLSNLTTPPSPARQVQRLIEYAINDA